MNPAILGVVGPGFLNQVPTLAQGKALEAWSKGLAFSRVLERCYKGSIRLL